MIAAFAITAPVMMVGAAIASGVGNYRIKHLQMKNKYIKYNSFLLSSNDGPDPCHNANDIALIEIKGLEDNMITDEGAYM